MRYPKLIRTIWEEEAMLEDKNKSLGSESTVEVKVANVVSGN